MERFKPNTEIIAVDKRQMDSLHTEFEIIKKEMDSISIYYDNKINEARNNNK